MFIFMLFVGGNEINLLWLVWGDMFNNKNDFVVLRCNFYLWEIVIFFVIFFIFLYYKDILVFW